MTDKKLLKMATEFRSGVLSGRDSTFRCYMVSAPLHGLLSAMGIEASLIEGTVKTGFGWNHFWIKLQDGRIIDPTADQFLKPDGSQNPAVYLGALPEWYTEEKLY